MDATRDSKEICHRRVNPLTLPRVNFIIAHKSQISILKTRGLRHSVMTLSSFIVLPNPNSLLTFNWSWFQVFTLGQGWKAQPHTHLVFSFVIERKQSGVTNRTDSSNRCPCEQCFNSLQDGTCSVVFRSDSTVVWRQDQNVCTVSSKTTTPEFNRPDSTSSPNYCPGVQTQELDYLQSFWHSMSVLTPGNLPKPRDEITPGSSHT